MCDRCVIGVAGLAEDMEIPMQANMLRQVSNQDHAEGYLTLNADGTTVNQSAPEFHAGGKGSGNADTDNIYNDPPARVRGSTKHDANAGAGTGRSGSKAASAPAVVVAALTPQYEYGALAQAGTVVARDGGDGAMPAYASGAELMASLQAKAQAQVGATSQSQSMTRVASTNLDKACAARVRHAPLWPHDISPFEPTVPSYELVSVPYNKHCISSL